MQRLRACNGRLSTAARRIADVILPGYTHMQRAQPVLAAALLVGVLRKA